MFNSLKMWRHARSNIWKKECCEWPGGRDVLRELLFLMLFFIFLGGWFVAWAAFHIAAGGIHLLLVLAVVFLLVHLFRGGRRAA
jgi:hypothetical protein